MPVLCSILFVLATLQVHGQSLFFRNIDRSTGLSHDKVNCIIQDKRGFLWIGTEDGLNRYDGRRFQVYRRNPLDSSSLSGNIISDIHEDVDGVLWIATADGGLCRFDYRLPNEEQFRQFRFVRRNGFLQPVNIVNDILEDDFGFLWLATSGNGVLRFNKKTGEMEEPEETSPRTSLRLAKDRDGIIWVGRQGGGLMKIDPAKLQYQEDIRYRDVYAKLPHMTIASLFLDSDDYMWMGSWDKVVYRQKLPSGMEEIFGGGVGPHYFSDDDPLAFAEDSSRRMWIGGKYGGLYLFDRQSGRLTNYRHDASKEGSLANNQVNCIYIDRSGMVWIGTNRGISYHDLSQQQFAQDFLPFLSDNEQVYDIVEVPHALLVGTSRGLYSQTKRDRQFRHIELRGAGEDLVVSKIVRTNDGSLYLGTNVSVYKYDQQENRVGQLKNTDRDIVMSRLIESRVVSIVEDTIDDHPVLLAVPYGHFIAYYDFIEKRWVSRQDTARQILRRFNIRDNLIRKIFKHSDGTLWIANAKMGLAEWKLPGKMYYHMHDPALPESISSNNVSDMAEDSNGNLWVSTYGGGLNYFDVGTRKFTHITSSHNLGEGLAIDRRGNVWMVANGNIHKYDPITRVYTPFQLPDIERTGGVRGSIFQCSRGKLYINGNNYLISFHPDSVTQQTPRTRVHFTDFKVFNRSYNQLLFQDQIQLQHNQNFFSVEFSAPVFQPGVPVYYSHQLEGVDEDWVDDGLMNTVNYTNLDGGTYRLKVRSANQPGNWSDDVTILLISIKPPFWKAWWFYLGVFVFAGAIIYSVYRYRINELVKRQDIRNKIAQDLHDSMGSTLSSISVYGQVAKIYQQQNREEALHDTLEKISLTSGEMISEMSDIVWAINPRQDNFQLIIQRMESYARPLLAAREINLYFTYEPDILFTNLEMSKRKNFYLIFKEAINNAVKYAECRNIWVVMTREVSKFRLVVQDDGKGFKPDFVRSSNSLAGNGLVNMKLRAKEMKGVLQIDSTPGSGTRIDIVFPIP